MHNGGAYGEGTTESSVGVEPGAARTTGKHGQFPFASGGTGDSGADRFAGCVGKDQPTNSPPVGTDQPDSGQIGGRVRGAGGVVRSASHSPGNVSQCEGTDRENRSMRTELKPSPTSVCLDRYPIFAKVQ